MFVTPHITYHSRIIAGSRTALGAMLLIVATTDPNDPGFKPELDDLLSLGYFAYALTLLALALRRWWFDFLMSRAALLADLLLFCGILVLVDPRTSAYMAITTGFPVHILLSTAMRLGWPAAVRVAAMLGAVWLGDLLWEHLAAQTLDLALTLRRAAILAVALLIASWAAIQATGFALPRAELDNRGDPEAAIASALRYVAMLSGAGRASLCWRDPGSGLWTAHRFLLATNAVWPEPLDPQVDFAPIGPATMLCDVGRGNAVVTRGNSLALGPRLTAAARDALTGLDFAEGIVVPLEVPDRHGWLLLDRFDLLTWSHLPLARGLAEELSRALSERTAITLVREIEARERREAEARELREEVARELHDTVAQSLVGARFMIAALRERVGDRIEIAEDLDRVKAALTAEYANVRQLIGQLRKTGAATATRPDAAFELARLCEHLAAQWNIAVRVSGPDGLEEASADARAELVSIVREAVANAVRHGQATAIEVALHRLPNSLHLTITDNGSGFAAEPPQQPRSIAERVEKLYGMLDISSAKGLTRIAVAIPLGVQA